MPRTESAPQPMVSDRLAPAILEEPWGAVVEPIGGAAGRPVVLIDGGNDRYTNPDPRPPTGLGAWMRPPALPRRYPPPR